LAESVIPDESSLRRYAPDPSKREPGRLLFDLFEEAAGATG
jgi:hypothetical protein